MEYFIKGTGHFFNLISDFFEYCEGLIYIIFAIIIILLSIKTFKNVK